VAHANWPLWRLPLVGEGHILGGGIFKRNYGEFSTGVDIWATLKNQLPKLPEIRRTPRPSRSWPVCCQMSRFTPLEFQLKHQAQTLSSSRPYLIDRKQAK